MASLIVSCATQPKNVGLIRIKDIPPCSEKITYPFNSVARYYRYEMIQNLMKYNEQKSGENLSFYSYWFKKWKTNFPDEAKLQCESISGDQMGEVSSFRIEKPILKRLTAYFSQAYEAEVLKKLSLKLLEEQKVKGWRFAIDQGKSPMTVLARHHKLKKAPTDLKMQNHFLQASLPAMEKEEGSHVADKTIQLLANPTLPRLVIGKQAEPEPSKKKSIYIFFNFTDLKDVSIHQLHEPRAHYFKEELLTRSDWIITGLQSPCEKGKAEIIPIENNEAGNSLIKKIETKLKLKPIHKKDITWYCL